VTTGDQRCEQPVDDVVLADHGLVQLVA